MKLKKITTKAFSLIEVIIIVILVSMSVGLAALYYQSSQVRSDVNSQTKTLVAYLRLAQSNADSGNTDFNGIHLDQTSYTLFTGATYNDSAPENYEIELPPTMIIQNIALNGNTTDIIFTTPKGETESYGAFQINSAQINKTNTITINQIGTINY